MTKSTKAPKELLNEAGESGKNAVKNICSTISNAATGLFNTLKAGYKVVDAGDKAIGNSIEKKLHEKGKDTHGKVGKFFRDNIFKLLLGAGILTGTGAWISNSSTDSDPENKKHDNKEIVSKKDSTSTIDIVYEKTNLNKKPLDLVYKNINEEKTIAMNYPENQCSVEGRISRCLRWSSITDVVEDRYGIPRGLLLALMAQEGWGDPTVINQGKYFENIGKNKGSYVQKGTGKNKTYVYVGKGNGDYEQYTCDGGAGLIHMQAVNARDLGLTTLERFNDKMRDGRHGRLLEQTKKDHKNNLSELSKLDDRFNPVLSVDASARYLVKMHESYGGNGPDSWIIAAEKYAGRGLSDYGFPVVHYWTVANSVRGFDMPTFSKNINDVVSGKVSASVNGKSENTVSSTKRVKKWFDNCTITLDGDVISFDEYNDYMKKQCENYGLKDYVDYNISHPYVK